MSEDPVLDAFTVKLERAGCGPCQGWNSDPKKLCGQPSCVRLSALYLTPGSEDPDIARLTELDLCLFHLWPQLGSYLAVDISDYAFDLIGRTSPPQDPRVS